MQPLRPGNDNISAIWYYNNQLPRGSFVWYHDIDISIYPALPYLSVQFYKQLLWQLELHCCNTTLQARSGFLCFCTQFQSKTMKILIQVSVLMPVYIILVVIWTYNSVSIWLTADEQWCPKMNFLFLYFLKQTGNRLHQFLSFQTEQLYSCSSA